MMWDLEHQEQIGVEPRGVRPVGHIKTAAKSRRKALLYSALVFVPILLFAVMLLLARK